MEEARLAKQNSAPLRLCEGLFFIVWFVVNAVMRFVGNCNLKL
jgi:hypothetical protein